MEIQTDSSKIESIKKGAQAAEKESNGFMEPGSKIKKPRGPYKKKGEPENSKSQNSNSNSNPQNSNPQKFEIKTSVALKPLLQIGSGLAVQFAQHPAAALTPDELEGGAEALGALLDKWMPSAFNKYGEEIVVAVIFGQWGMRVASIRAQIQAQKNKPQTPENPITNPTVNEKPAELIVTEAVQN